MTQNYVQALRVMPSAHFQSLCEMPECEMTEMTRHYV